VALPLEVDVGHGWWIFWWCKHVMFHTKLKSTEGKYPHLENVLCFWSTCEQASTGARPIKQTIIQIV
jgi:hypothetical protein